MCAGRERDPRKPRGARTRQERDALPGAAHTLTVFHGRLGLGEALGERLCALCAAGLETLALCKRAATAAAGHALGEQDKRHIQAAKKASNVHPSSTAYQGVKARGAHKDKARVELGQLPNALAALDSDA